MVKKVYKKGAFKLKSAGPIDLESLRTSVNLMIVESPSKCKKIEGFLGSQWTCIASKGHIRSVDGLSSIDPATYAVTYSMISDKKDHVEWMKGIIAKFDRSHVYIATDDDREGEAIGWHICDVFGLPIETTKRVLFHEITEPAIKTAIENPTAVDMNKVRAQQSRQVLDLLVGYRISPLLWKYLYRNKENSLSAGRCQTPALRLVYENEMESKAAIIETKYQIKAVFYAKKIEFTLAKQIAAATDVLDFLEKSKTYSHKMSVGVKRESMQQPPKPFSTSSILQAASSELHISPKETMSLCQELYQNGFITYMRTESQSYSDVFLKEAQTYIRAEFKEELCGGLRCADESNPHEAIRVTHIEVKTIDAAEYGRAATLYKFIWQNTVASCMSESKSYHTPVYISAPCDMRYEHVIEVPISLGWKKVYSSNVEKESVHKDQNSGAALLMYMQHSPIENVPYSQIRASISVHGRHSHYTEASLIRQLEVLGIGRPSTYATIINTIIERGYVKKMDIEGVPVKTNEFVLTPAAGVTEIPIDKMIGQEKDKLRIQPVGMMVSDFLTESFTTFFAYDYTKTMEESLDQIAAGGATVDICKQCDADIAQCIKNMTKIEKPTFALCDTDEYKIVFERYGPVLRKVLADGSYQYENTNPNLDMDRLKSGGYSLAEVMTADKNIGEYEGTPVILKSGPYGRYIEYNGITVKSEDATDATDATDADVLKTFIEQQTGKKDKTLIRELTPNISIRNGRYGAYVYYKTPEMKKPQFFNLNSFRESYRLCSQETILNWIKEKHNVS